MKDKKKIERILAALDLLEEELIESLREIGRTRKAIQAKQDKTRFIQ